MANTFKKEQLIVKKFRHLSLKKQQKLIDFAENLADKQKEKSLFAYKVFKKFAGCLDFGSGDLSTNKNDLISGCFLGQNE